MVPEGVTVEEADGLVTWTRGEFTVSFIPSADPAVRKRQEDDLAHHLVEREEQEAQNS